MKPKKLVTPVITVAVVVVLVVGGYFAFKAAMNATIRVGYHLQHGHRSAHA